MKNGCNEILEAKIVERSERAKKLYRYISDVARRVSEATGASRSIAELFSTSLEVQRQKLRDNCEKLLFLDPLNYGKKSLELLWRKVYYDTVYAAKKLKESNNECDSYLFTHIVCGIGHFHHFISRIQSDMKIQYKELDYTPMPSYEESEDAKDDLSEDEQQFGRAVLHSCLIYLGDLSRYQVEIFHTCDSSIAARYYLQAVHIDMSLGMPFNQLGNLYLDRNYNVDSVCYYIHCLGCQTPFEGATGNLMKIFEKNSQFCDSINESETVTQSEHIQSTVSNFLSLIEIWYLSKNDTNIPQRCNTIAHQLKEAMEFIKSPFPDVNKFYNEHLQAVEEENINPSYLNGNLIHKITQICLFTIAKMNETDEQKAFACKAFTLALLSQLLQKLLTHLQSIGLQNPANKHYPRNCSVLSIEIQKQEKPEVNGVVSETSVLNGDSDNHDETKLNNDIVDEDPKPPLNGDAKVSNKKLASKRRRRRRVASSESSEMSDENTESSEVDTDQCSEDEYLSDSTYHSDDDSKSEGSLDDVTKAEEPDEKINAHPDKQENINGDIKINNENMETLPDTKDANNTDLNVDELQNFLLGDNFLSSIKLLLDWVLTEKDLIVSCGDSGESLFQCVVDLLNIFTFYFESKKVENLPDKASKVLDYTRHVAKNLKLEFKTIPLPEDVNLRGTNICKFDKDAAEWQILGCYNPTAYEENVIRILNFIDFGNQIAKIVPRIRFNKSMKIFYYKKVTPPKLNTKINHKRSREWHNSKKQQAEGGESGLLRRLGRLWLASQVRELERGQSAAPALLALDTPALHIHLRRVKQLLRARNFILLVPAVVLQELDELKREQSTARDAIRWLEIQLKSGSRFLRAQRPGQSKPLPLLKYPRKAPPHVHNYIQILEFCNHFMADEKGGNGDPDSSLHGKSAPLLILLVGNEPGTEMEQYKEFSMIGAAQSAGISVQHIGDFYMKWRQSAHRSGKKR